MQHNEHQQTQQSEEEDYHERLPEETQRLLGNEAAAKEKALNHDRELADPDEGHLHHHARDNDEAENIDANRSMRSSEYARLAMQRQQQFNINRRNNNRDGIRANLRERDEFHDQARGGNVDGAPPPAAAGVGANQEDGNQNNNGANNRTNLLDISHGSLGLNMSFGNMWTSLNEAEEQRITEEFFFDMIMMIICVTVIYCCIQMEPKGCGIPVREWLMYFSIIYFSRSVFQIGKIGIVRYLAAIRLYYDIAAFIIANGILIYWMYRGFDMFYSDANDCDNYDSTAFFNSIMFMVLFIGYLIGFVYLMVLLTLPCLYFMIREQAETTRLNSGGVGRSQVPMILASLSRTQYDPQVFQHEKQCIVCLVDYTENDMVTQLRCDERHYFHTKCIEDWVKQGNNRCPFCRAPIIDFSRQNEDADSAVSSHGAHNHGAHNHGAHNHQNNNNNQGQQPRRPNNNGNRAR